MIHCWRIVVIMFLFIGTGCERNNQDLLEEISSIKQSATGSVSPLPEVRPFSPLLTVIVRDPFEPLENKQD